MKVCRLLIVEDRGDIAELLADFFSHEGYRIATAATAAEMEVVLDREEVDVVILDLILPGGVSGWNAVEQVCSRNVGVILVTGDHQHRDRLESSGLHYLMKPFRLQVLLEEVEAVLRETDAACAPEKRRGAA